MKKFFSALKQTFQSKSENPFSYQLNELKNRLDVEVRAQIDNKPVVACIGEDGLQRIKQVKLSSPNIEKLTLNDAACTISYFAYCSGQLFHILTGWPKDDVIIKQLADFYRQNIADGRFRMSSSVTLDRLDDPALLQESFRSYQNLVTKLNLAQCEWRLDFSDTLQNSGLHSYLNFCLKHKGANCFKLDLAKPLKEQLTSFEQQRRASLLTSSIDDYLNILACISVLIQYIRKIYLALTSWGSNLACWEIWLYFSFRVQS